jgi:hypothetical protein
VGCFEHPLDRRPSATCGVTLTELAVAFDLRHIERDVGYMISRRNTASGCSPLFSDDLLGAHYLFLLLMLFDSDWRPRSRSATISFFPIALNTVAGRQWTRST